MYYLRKNLTLCLAPQFSRCLWQTLGLQLTPAQEELVKANYDLNGNGQINYKLFCDIIDQNFNANNLAKDPEAQKIVPPELYVFFFILVNISYLICP
jgi:hypothetical protein